MSRTLAAILGGAAGVVALVGILLIILWYCLLHGSGVSRTSETGSSDPSVQVGRATGIEFTLRDARRFEIEELLLATRNFSDKSLIGQGKFGEVYKGLLHDGMLVAIKRRPGRPTQEFIDEVRYLASIQHRNLVTLLGYCQESNLQILIYEYIPNGSVSIHLYGGGQVSREKLEFKHRLSIALGAAKGDPLQNQVKEFGRFSEKSDVYSFGVFLLELLSGRMAKDLLTSDVMVEWVQNHQDCGTTSTMIDQRLGNSFTTEGVEEFINLIVNCVNPSSERRPAMSYVVTELDRILEKEMSLTTIMGEGTPVVTLGSQLFRSSK